MIIYRRWQKENKRGKVTYWHGWFLFGIIPLYVAMA